MAGIHSSRPTVATLSPASCSGNTTSVSLQAECVAEQPALVDDRGAAVDGTAVVRAFANNSASFRRK